MGVSPPLLPPGTPRGAILKRKDGPRILVVDDHDVFRRGLKSLLSESSLGDVCGEAENGEQAIEKVKALKPDLVVLDISMPVMNGLEAARRIRQMAPSTKILILTMHDSSQMLDTAKKAGADDLVVKSEASAKLVGAVKHLLETDGARK